MSGTNVPKIVCLCGSTRFMTAFYDANMRETLAGRIVLTVGMSSHGDYHLTDAQKAALDELHLRKIDLADEVLVIDPSAKLCDTCGKPCKTDTLFLRSVCCDACWKEQVGYVGDSTRREIAYAESLGKPVRYLSKESQT